MHSNAEHTMGCLCTLHLIIDFERPPCPNEFLLKKAEEDVGSIFCINDSSSDDDDLIHPDNTLDSGDSDYHPPSSESGEDLQPLQFTPQPGPSAPPPTTWQKRGRSSQGTSSTPGKKSGKRFRSSEGKKEERWHDRDEEDIKPDAPRFMPARTPGPTVDTTKAWSPISLFQLFFSASVVRTIIENTNANAVKRKRAGMKFKWEVLTAKDFYTFLAIVIFTGLVTVQNRSDYWRKKWLYNFPFPSEKMTQDRFEAIMWSLHLSNPEEDEENEKKRSTAEYDRLFKIKPLYTEMVDACKAHFQPYNNLSIDEQIVATKAQISLKQYIKEKPTKWGYKIFVLRDTSIGYTWNFFVYTGKRESPRGHGLSYSAVMDLMPFPLLGTGYTLYTDNFYTSPTLCTDLSTKKIGCCGTIGKHRNGFPQTQTNDLPKKAERGDIRWIRSGKLLYVKWMGTREVTMCSTVHQAYSGQTVRRKVKEAGVWHNKSIPVPDCIVDYSRNMGRIDLSDALIGFYRIHHKKTKWYKTLFYHFLDIAVVNSYLLHKELFEIKQDPTQAKPLIHKAFREQLAKEMLVFAERPAATPPLTTCMPIFFDSEARKHCKRCKDAGTPRVKTAVYCRKCNVPLCLSSKRNCFQEWHDGQ
ncbi:piggyBac transposable element-derived protein 4-like isoform X2 [Mastacembelus armatus]|uniref:piggyBac transposable element-derived protein 4-like isoform X2 n=1 Tax=Mastacembelus armatus TaxID=205130 RepID=UPI000E455CA4|nr:piggyBac transposable element-derived protein 4-like isoform X2 [Mastacembelus armatus]XP_026161495.1 piggyBac transposable element-derived protein 4-like isoform X2 [Mastacembelus armatus]